LIPWVDLIWSQSGYTLSRDELLFTGFLSRSYKDKL